MALRRLSIVLVAFIASPVLAQPLDLEVKARPIPHFMIASTQTTFGPFEFVGGLELTSGNADFGAISALRFRDDGVTMLSVSDNGFWVTGRIGRDAEGRPSTVTHAKIAPLSDRNGNESEKKWLSDAEGLLVDGDQISVSFERDHRISTGALDPETFGFTFENEPLPVPAQEIRSNRGFETLAKSPAGSPLDGARVAVTEKSLDPNGNIFAGVMDGPGRGTFFIARDGEYDITDGDFLPNGDLLLLERRYNMAVGVAMRIRRITGADIKKGATVSGTVLMEADMAYQIDNMEGLDVWTRADGATMVSIMSDDNHSLLQRNLYLEFRLVE